MSKAIATLFLICIFTGILAKLQSIESELIEFAEQYDAEKDRQIENLIKEMEAHPDNEEFKRELVYDRAAITAEKSNLAGVLKDLKAGLINDFHPTLNPVLPGSYNGTLVDEFDYLKILESIDDLIFQYDQESEGEVVDAESLMKYVSHWNKTDGIYRYIQNVLIPLAGKLNHQGHDAQDDAHTLGLDLLNLISKGEYAKDAEDLKMRHYYYDGTKKAIARDYEEMHVLNHEIETDDEEEAAWARKKN